MREALVFRPFLDPVLTRTLVSGVCRGPIAPLREDKRPALYLLHLSEMFVASIRKVWLWPETSSLQLLSYGKKGSRPALDPMAPSRLF